MTSANLQILGGVASQLKHLGGKVFCTMTLEHLNFGRACETYLRDRQCYSIQGINLNSLEANVRLCNHFETAKILPEKKGRPRNKVASLAFLKTSMPCATPSGFPRRRARLQVSGTFEMSRAHRGWPLSRRQRWHQHDRWMSHDSVAQSMRLQESGGR